MSDLETQVIGRTKSGKPVTYSIPHDPSWSVEDHRDAYLLLRARYDELGELAISFPHLTELESLVDLAHSAGGFHLRATLHEGERSSFA